MTDPIGVPLRHLTLGVALGDLARGVREVRPNWSPRIKEYLRNAGIAAPADVTRIALAGGAR